MRWIFLIVFLLQLGCGGAWPAACQAKLDRISCRCTEVRFAVKRHPERPAPAGRLVTTCDGQALPLTVDGEDFTTERAP